MTAKPRRLIENPPPGLRERARADGSVRIWWEPSAAARAKGAVPVELDANRLTWSVRQAEKLNKGTGDVRRRPVGQTIDHLIDTYEHARHFRKLTATTQRSYRTDHGVIRAKWGGQLVAAFTKPVMHAWYETLYDTRGQTYSLALMRAMSRLFAHAERIGWRDQGSNPCARLQMETPKGRRRVADWAETDALIAAADRLGLASMGTAIALSSLNGQRQTDIRLARRGAFALVQLQLDGDVRPQPYWVWSFERSKRGNAGMIVIHPEAAPRIAAIMARPGQPEDRLLVDERTHQGWSDQLICKRFAEVRQAAIAAGCTSLADLQFRDLRRTFGIRSRTGGADKADVGDVLGNSAAVNQALADIYMTPTLFTAARATMAVQRPANPERKKA